LACTFFLTQTPLAAAICSVLAAALESRPSSATRSLLPAYTPPLLSCVCTQVVRPYPIVAPLVRPYPLIRPYPIVAPLYGGYGYGLLRGNWNRVQTSSCTHTGGYRGYGRGYGRGFLRGRYGFLHFIIPRHLCTPYCIPGTITRKEVGVVAVGAAGVVAGVAGAGAGAGAEVALVAVADCETQLLRVNISIHSITVSQVVKLLVMVKSLFSWVELSCLAIEFK
jgi:hypothetical protein